MGELVKMKGELRAEDLGKKLGRPLKPTTKTMPKIAELMGTAAAVIQMQLGFLVDVSSHGEMTESEMKKLLGLVDATIKVSKEERERQKHDDPKKLTTEQLRAIVRAADLDDDES